MKRREFVKTLGTTGIALYASDLVADLIAQSPRQRVLESKFKGLADIALDECKKAGCSYYDVRLTRNLGLPGVNAFATNDASVTADDAGGRGGRSEERRVGKECNGQCRSRWSPYH